jgi:hypothetical protein
MVLYMPSKKREATAAHPSRVLCPPCGLSREARVSHHATFSLDKSQVIWHNTAKNGEPPLSQDAETRTLGKTPFQYALSSRNYWKMLEK